jgi:hypothetical protein
MAKEVAKASASNLPAISGDGFEEFAGAGLENVGSNDILIPRLTILQSLSPQLNKKKAEFIEGSEIGSIVDVGTGEMFPEGVLFLPVHYRKEYLEWAPRASGQGLVKVHSDASILDQAPRNDRNQNVLPNGNYIAETAQWFGLNLTADRRKCFIPMASTQLKKSRKWMTLATSERLKRPDGSEFAAPLFYRSYKLTTGTESNSQGEWASWAIARGATLPELGEMLGVDWRAVKEEAVEFAKALQSGAVKADNADDPTETGPTNEGAM